MKLEFPGVNGSIEVYMDVMRAICGETEGKSMLDLMCCFAPNTPKLGFSSRTYIDKIARELDIKEEQEFFYPIEVSTFFREMQGLHWDVAICSDGIEHVTKEYGAGMLADMAIASDKQIIFTPLGELFMSKQPDDGDPERHRSAWYPEDFLKDEFFGYPFACIVFPHYHKTWNVGAFFAFRCKNIATEFLRVRKELWSKPWAQGMKTSIRPALLPPGPYTIIN